MAKKRKLSQNSTLPIVKSEPLDPIIDDQQQPPPVLKSEPLELPQNPYQQQEEEKDDHSEDGSDSDSESESESDPESIQKLLEVFPKDQLVSLLRDAAVSHPSILAEIRRIADVDLSHRKIFVHGLGWDTTKEILTSFFSQFGEIEDLNAVSDKSTGRSKGYAFILFKHRKGAVNALKEPQKKIGSRTTSCQLASAGPVQPHAAAVVAQPVSEYTQRKIYVSNVGAELDPGKLLQFFGRFGEIEEGPLGLDKVTGKPKGFCLFVYKSVESARKALEEPHKNYEGHVLHCQRALDGPKGFKNVQHHVNHRGKSKNVAVQGGGGQLMVPLVGAEAGGLGYIQGVPGNVAAPGLNPVIGQALTALLATQGGGLGGLTHLLGAAAGPVVNNGLQQGGPYGGQVGGVGGYGVQGAPVQGGYGGGQMGYGGSGGVRGQPGYGHASGGPPYMGHH